MPTLEPAAAFWSFGVRVATARIRSPPIPGNHLGIHRHTRRDRQALALHMDVRRIERTRVGWIAQFGWN